MPVSSENSIAGPYYPNGVTRSFAFDFKAASEGEVVAADADGNIISPALYSITLDDDEGGTLSFDVAPSAGIYPVIYVMSEPALTQPSDFDNSGPSFNPAALTRAIDRAAIRDLKLHRDIGRALKLPFGEAEVTFPGVADRANKFLSFLPNGDVLMASGTGADAGLRQDIASSSGGEMVGFLQDGAGAILRNLLAKAKETLSTTDMDAVIDGTTDDSDALIATFAQMAVTGRANLLSGTYKVTKPLTIPPGILEGGNVVLDFRDANPADFPGAANGTCVTVQGSAMTQIANLDTDLAIGDRIFSFAGAHGLREGDSFQLSGTVDYAGNGYRAYYRKGEMFRVAYVIGDPETSTDLAVEGACRDSYPAADVEVWKRSGDGFTNGCASLTVLGPDTIGQVIAFIDLDLSNISRLRAEGGKWSAISTSNCFGLFGDNLKARQNAAGTSNYGIVVGNSQDVRLKGYAYGYFNGITIGGGLTAGGLVGMNRDVHFEGIGASHPTGGLAGANFHGNSENCSYRGVFFNGLVMAGYKNEAYGEYIGNSGQPPVQFAEMHGHEYYIGGTARTTGVDLSTSVGAIHQSGFGKNSAAPGTPSTARYGGRGVLDLRLYAEQATRAIWYRPTDLARSDVVLDVRLDIVKGHGTTRLMIFSTSGSGSDFPLVEINRLNVLDSGPAISWSVSSGTAFKNMKNEQSVTVTGTGVALATQAVTFPIPFPRTPIITPGLASQVVGGSKPQALGLTNGGSSATGCTVQIGSADGSNQNYSATVSVVAVSR